VPHDRDAVATPARTVPNTLLYVFLADIQNCGIKTMDLRVVVFFALLASGLLGPSQHEFSFLLDTEKT
jgi:hypothetical protein